MDPLTAFGVAVNVLTVVQISAEIVSAGREAYQTGRLGDHDDLKSVAEDLRAQNEKLEASMSKGGPSKEDKMLLKMAKRSNEVASELTELLLKIEPADKENLVKSLKVGIRKWWKRDKIESTAKRLQTLRDQVGHHILVIVKEQGDHQLRQQTEQFEALDTRQKELVRTVLQSAKTARDASETQSRKLDELLSLLKQLMVSREGQAEESRIVSNTVYRTDAAAVLLWLRFSSMTDRRETISKAHRKTFQWIFERDADQVVVVDGHSAETEGYLRGQGAQSPDPNQISVHRSAVISNSADGEYVDRDHDTDEREKKQDQYRPKTGFPEWLEQGNRIFWIHGKPGCGKSTLMKLITNDTRTYDLLRKWAAEKPLIVSSFYFWASGTELQRSLNGLFRGLLYDIIQRRTELADIAFPAFRLIPKEEPTLSELQAGLKRILDAGDLSFRLCFFVDGLDEFEGKGMRHSKLAQNFCDIVQSEDIKAVIASRPLTAIADVFREYQSLAVHQLTESDIKKYIQDTLASHPKFIALAKRYSSEHISDLIMSILNRASGVFLWVTITVNALLDGLRNQETLSELTDRLDELPPDLEGLYKHMFAMIPPAHKAKAAQIILLTDRALKWIYRLTALRLSFMLERDDKLAFHYPSRPLTRREAIERCDDMSNLVQSRCLGLLEVKHQRDIHALATTNETLSIDDHRDVWDGYAYVEFAHRSVLEFINQEEIRQDILHAAGAKFNPGMFLIRSFLIEAKTIAFTQGSGTEIFLKSLDCLAEVRMHMLGCCARYEEDESLTCLAELDEMRRLTDSVYDRRVVSNQSLCFAQKTSLISHLIREEHYGGYNSILIYALSAGTFLYLTEKLNAEPGLVSDRHGLLHRLFALEYDGLPLFADSLTPVRFLLERGSNPNDLFGGVTAWQILLSKVNRSLICHSWGVTEASTKGETFSPKQFMRLMNAMLDFGADPNCVLCTDDVDLVKGTSLQLGTAGRHSVTTIVQRLLSAVEGLSRCPSIEDLWLDLEDFDEYKAELCAQSKSLLRKLEQKKAEVDKRALRGAKDSMSVSKQCTDGSWQAKAKGRLRLWKK